MVFQLTSPAFIHKEPIPRRYSCNDENISPELCWQEAPPETSSFGLIMDDPDAPAGTWVHWVFYNIPVKLTGLPMGVPPVPIKNQYGIHGKNSWGNYGYGGPCPPAGVHRYFFKLYALDAVLDYARDTTKTDLLRMMQKHIITMTELMGTYEKF